jgi:hypothetical protein
LALGLPYFFGAGLFTGTALSMYRTGGRAKMKGRRPQLLLWGLSLLGAALFAYFVWQARPGEIVANLRQLGAGFLLLLLCSGARKAVRARAWQRCVEAPHKLRFSDAFRAVVMGDAIGNVLPFGTLVVAEPSKAVFAAGRVPLLAALAGITIENLFYSLSVALFMLSGMLTLLVSFPQLPKPLRVAAFGTLVGVGVFVALWLYAVTRQWRFVSGACEWLYRRGILRKQLETGRDKARELEDQIYRFYRNSRAAFLSILLLEAAFHLFGVLEIYLTLHFISDLVAPTLLAAFLFESVNRVINVSFKFIPLKAGVDEAGTGWLAQALGFGTSLGVTVAILRKARDIFWAAAGALLLLQRGFSLRTVGAETKAALEQGTQAETRA